MNILYISQYFPPEVGATQNRAVEMASHLVRMGHQVTVLTEFPNHPKGIIPQHYRGRLFEIDELNGIRVIRVWVLARPKKNFFTRMGFYLSFMFVAGLVGTFSKGRYDIVYATSPPYFVGVTGLWLSAVKRARFVYEVRDLWLRSAKELGEVNNPRILRWAGHLDDLYYRKATRVIAVTQGIHEELLAKGLKDKLHLVYNGTNSELLCDRGPGKRHELGWDGRFVVLYAGILGIAQGLEHICATAREMKAIADVQFVFIGEGPVKEQVRQLQKEWELSNLVLMDQVAREEIADYISAADCCLVPLKNKKVFRGALPSKMFDIMACQRPVILSVDGEARDLLDKVGAGIFVEPENVEQLQQAILRLKSDRALCERMGRAGRSFVENHFSRRQSAITLEGILQQVMQE
jgi:glycosyltransferase involved in cell wall biosynthesis